MLKSILYNNLKPRKRVRLQMSHYSKSLFSRVVNGLSIRSRTMKIILVQDINLVLKFSIQFDFYVLCIRLQFTRDKHINMRTKNHNRPL